MTLQLAETSVLKSQPSVLYGANLCYFFLVCGIVLKHPHFVQNICWHELLFRLKSG